VNAQANLLEIIAATHSPSGFASCLHGRQQKPDQDANDGDNDQQLHQREPAERDALFAFLMWRKQVPAFVNQHFTESKKEMRE
jgi:hypothetical protein